MHYGLDHSGSQPFNCDVSLHIVCKEYKNYTVTMVTIYIMTRRDKRSLVAIGV